MDTLNPKNNFNQEEEKMQSKPQTGEIKFQNGEKYFGHIQNGKPHGHGVLTDK